MLRLQPFHNPGAPAYKTDDGTKHFQDQYQYRRHHGTLSLLDVGSEDEDEDALLRDAHPPAREDDWMDCDPSEIGNNRYQLETYHIESTKRKLHTPRNLHSPHSSSWKDHRTSQIKTVTKHFKYTDVHGNDLWACVKTVYASKDSYEVYIADGNGAWHHVKLLQDKRHVSRIREPYSDVTKYWRDHYVPSYSIERSKPCVLRDSFVPSYSRLSARAQAWRGFIKPKLSLMERISPPRRRDKYVPRCASRHGNHRADSHASRSFNKYRNRQRDHSLNNRIKINLATIVPSSTAEVGNGQSLVDKPAADQEKLMKKLYTVIIENMPQDTQESDAMVST